VSTAGAEAEDRTQAPSKRRRQLARAAGQVAHSPELTAAAGLLAASLVLSACGDGLATALAAPLREALAGPEGLPVSADAAEVVARVRRLALGVAGPLGLVVGAFAAGALAAHQAQVGGLWAPGLFAPDPARLWAPARGSGPGLAGQATRGLWSLARAVVVAAVAAWVVRSDGPGLQSLGGLDAPAIARASGAVLRHLALTLAAATAALGLVDFALRYARFEAMLRMTPEQSREDMRSAEGDPALRARRRRLARAWRHDPAEVLAGASLVLTGPSGLAVVLSGGPPPRPVSIRSTASGPPGERLADAAETMGVPRADAPSLARRLARLRPPALRLTPDLLTELAPHWPAGARTTS
jgi:flagellar biosynthetic protein FlhB